MDNLQMGIPERLESDSTLIEGRETDSPPPAASRQLGSIHQNFCPGRDRNSQWTPQMGFPPSPPFFCKTGPDRAARNAEKMTKESWSNTAIAAARSDRADIGWRDAAAAIVTIRMSRTYKSARLTSLLAKSPGLRQWNTFCEGPDANARDD